MAYNWKELRAHGYWLGEARVPLSQSSAIGYTPFTISSCFPAICSCFLP